MDIPLRVTVAMQLGYSGSTVYQGLKNQPARVGISNQSVNADNVHASP